MCSRGSPTTSPVIHLCRRKTLRMLLSRSGSGRRYNGSPDQLDDYRDSQWEGKDLVVSHKLKDLCVSSALSPDEKSSGLWLQKVGEDGCKDDNTILVADSRWSSRFSKGVDERSVVMVSEGIREGGGSGEMAKGKLRRRSGGGWWRCVLRNGGAARKCKPVPLRIFFGITEAFQAPRNEELTA
nr:uncharacterized protein LOC109177626 isoform X3 [Ipomoea batatas]